VDEDRGIGGRVRDVRKRRGLTQRDLAELSGVSLAVIRKIEQGIYGGVRLEMAHRFAVALRVPTSSLVAGPDAREPGRSGVVQWEPVRVALAGEGTAGAGDEPTLAAVEAGFQVAVSAVLSNHFAELCLLLPDLLRDAGDLVAVSAGDAGVRARGLRSQVRLLAAFMMGQTWQFTAASDAIGLAGDDADDELMVMAVADWKCWVMIRQGRLAEAGALAARWADDAEPQSMSRATPDQLAAWGRFLVRVSAAAVRDNQPAEAADALRLARMAAGTGKDALLRFNPWQVFGPVTVSMFQAQNALIQDRPARALSIGQQLAGGSFPLPETWNRHRLDVASAHVAIREYPEAVGVLQEVRQAAPEWLAQQRYAGDILHKVIQRRRSLTTEMRELADFLSLSL
jgi:transcriptional regulator with XRE-family HTH domain